MGLGRSSLFAHPVLGHRGASLVISPVGVVAMGLREASAAAEIRQDALLRLKHKSKLQQK